MARRNRKKTKVHGFIFPVPIAGLLVLLSILGLAYVWLGYRCEALGRELKELETERAALRKKYLNEEYRWTQMKSLENIERVLLKHRIRMSWPHRDQVVSLPNIETLQAELAETTDDYFKLARLEKAVVND